MKIECPFPENSELASAYILGYKDRQLGINKVCPFHRENLTKAYELGHEKAEKEFRK